MGNGWNVRGSMAPSQKINELSYSSGSSEDSPLSYSKKGERKINLPDTEPKYDQKKLQSLLLYPEECKNKGIEGRVLLEVKVDKFGKAQKIKIDDSDDKKLDSAAINAVKAITFSPGSVNGVKEEKWIDVPVYFILNPKTKITIDKIFKGSGDKIKAGSWANIKVAIYDYDFNTLLYSNNKGLNISPEILSKSNLLKYVIGMKPGAKYIIFIPADGTDFTLFDNNMIKNNGLIIELDILE
jgi:TonB family protein